MRLAALHNRIFVVLGGFEFAALRDLPRSGMMRPIIFNRYILHIFVASVVFPYVFKSIQCMHTFTSLPHGLDSLGPSGCRLAAQRALTGVFLRVFRRVFLPAV